MQVDLQGRTGIVCGSTQGIGLASARALAENGCRILLISRNENRLVEVAAELPNQELGHSFLSADFSEPHVLSEKLEKIKEESIWANILVNNTGGPKGGPASTADLEEYRIAFNAHLICNQILLRSCLKKMKESNYGRVINIISTSIKQPIQGLGVSNTIRGAVAQWAKTIATELGPFGITVNNVLPGATETARLDSLIESKSDTEGIPLDEVTKKMLAGIPARRFGKAEELANAVLYLASDEASYVNGINLPVDGGRTGSL